MSTCRSVLQAAAMPDAVLAAQEAATNAGVTCSIRPAQRQRDLSPSRCRPTAPQCRQHARYTAVATRAGPHNGAGAPVKSTSPSGRGKQCRPHPSPAIWLSRTPRCLRTITIRARSLECCADHSRRACPLALPKQKRFLVRASGVRLQSASMLTRCYRWRATGPG